MNTQDSNVTDVVDKNTPRSADGFHLSPAQLTKQPGDVDLIEKCREILVGLAIDPEQLAVYDSAHTLIMAKNMTTFAQRTALNQFWHLQMGPFGRLSHMQRYKLIENGTVDDWLRLFNQGPAQFIIDNKLPVPF